MNSEGVFSGRLPKKEGGQIVSRKRYGYTANAAKLFAEKRLKEL